MGITAQEVNALRQKTGAGMMDCKKALTATNGNVEEAIEWLRKKGEKLSVERADRATTEGMVFLGTNTAQNEGILIALGCETDFVAKNEDFQALGTKILTVALDTLPADLTALLQTSVTEGQTIENLLTDMMGKIGEKLTVIAYAYLKSEVVVPYRHNGNKLGVLVGLTGTASEAVNAAGKDVAMQIAAMNPLAVGQEDIDPTIVEKELTLARDMTRAAGKPEAMIEQIAQGKLNKFFKEHTLLSQPFVKDNSQTVATYLESVVSGLTVKSFERVRVG